MNRNGDALFAWLVIIYLIAGILAFGHSAANSKNCSRPNIPEPELCRAFGGFFAAFVNPLYWSWVAFERPEKDASK